MKKVKMIVAAGVLLAVLLTGGVLAYFTDTKTATNVFTIGNVAINLTEPNWVENDAKDLMPGEVVAKDPTITNTGNNTAFVFMKLEVPCVGTKELFTYTLNSGWNLLNSTACTSGKATKVYDYGTSSALTVLNKNASTPALMNSVTLVDLTNDEASSLTGNINMVVTGYGIQSEGLTSTAPNSVWSNFSS